MYISPNDEGSCVCPVECCEIFVLPLLLQFLLASDRQSMICVVLQNMLFSLCIP